MRQISENALLSENDDSLLQLRKRQQIEGQRFLRFALTNEVRGLIPLADLQGTIEVMLKEILPVPQVSEFWLGIVNWQGDATWIIDLAGLLGGTHWCRKNSIAQSGIAMLTQVDQQKVGLLVEKVNGIENYDPQLCLPVSHVTSSIRLSSLIKGYFLDIKGDSLMLLNVPSLITMLQL